MFSEYGDISYCKIVVNQQTGLSKGTGFIQFKTNEAAQSCITATSVTDGKVSNTYMYVNGIAFLYSAVKRCHECHKQLRSLQSIEKICSDYGKLMCALNF